MHNTPDIESERAMKEEISIYIHIPFCESKCCYCAFNSFCATKEEQDEYINLLLGEIAKRSKAAVGKVVKSIYIGGGTPSVLDEVQFAKIAHAIFDNFDVYDNAEFTVEANPNSITEEKLACWKSLRVNRISIGVQSLNDRSLKKIGRLHTKQMALEKIKLVRKTFDNVSCDLIVGLEGDNGKTLSGYAKTLLSLGIKHISCYLLEVYDNVPLGTMVKNGKYIPLSDERTIAAFEKLSNYLQDNGMTRYEISNFAFPGYESRHNLNYWQRGEYLGFGISAHSFVDGRRTENAATISDYAKGKITEEILSPREIDEEIIMLGLRCNLGFDITQLQVIDLQKNAFFKDYLQQGILQQQGNLVKLNPMFYRISNTIISNLF